MLCCCRYCGKQVIKLGLLLGTLGIMPAALRNPHGWSSHLQHAGAGKHGKAFACSEDKTHSQAVFVDIDICPALIALTEDTLELNLLYYTSAAQVPCKELEASIRGILACQGLRCRWQGGQKEPLHVACPD